MNRIKKFKRYNKKGMKRFASRKTRRIGSDGVRVKCEDHGALTQNNGTDFTIFADSSQPFFNIVTMLQNSVSFQNQHNLYQRYKITGVSIRLGPTTDTAFLSGRFPQGYTPPQIFAFYPNFTSQNLGNSVLGNDNSLTFDPAGGIPAYKYWKCPDNYFDAGGYGFGIWSRSAGFINQVGQFAVTPGSPNIIADKTAICSYRVTVHVVFSNKNF